MLVEFLRRLDDRSTDGRQLADCIEQLYAENSKLARHAVATLAERNREQREAGEQLAATLEKVVATNRTLTSPPLHSAVFLGPGEAGSEQLAEVRYGSSRMLVRLGEALTLSELMPGDTVFLGPERNVIVLRSPHGAGGDGFVASVERWLAPGRLLIRDRDAQRTVRVSPTLTPDNVASGDSVRLDHSGSVAVECMASDPAAQFAVFEEIGELPPEALAGQDRDRDRILKRVVSAISDPELARRYQLPTGEDRILLTGPPGCGKTTTMRLLASAVGRAVGRRCLVARLNGAEFYSPYVGESERNIRVLMRGLGDHDGPAMLFIDELDAIGRARGTLGNVHGDRFLGSLLPELEGIQGTSRVLVVAATNRPEVLDAALRERFAWEIRLPRPGAGAARAIIAWHLGRDLPYRPNGALAAQARDELIELATARLFDPNAGNEIATLRMRDGKARVVYARELVSGRLIEQICRSARERAFQRDLEGGEPGVGLGDMDAALDQAIGRLRGTLSRHNARAHLADLPQDVDVIAVEPCAPLPGQRRFLQ